MKTIILNSGKGSRLKELTDNIPKSLVKIYDDESIFSRAIKILSKFGIDEFIITTGYLDSVLIDYCENNFPELNFTFVYNPYYDETNYIKSIDLIDDIADDVILLHGDLVFDEMVAHKVINSNESTVVIDSTIPIPEDDFKAKIDVNHVKYIGVDYFDDDAVACQPFYKLLEDDWKHWKSKIRDFCDNGETGVYAENALNSISDELIIVPLDLKGLLCMEVDNKHDLAKVREILK